MTEFDPTKPVQTRDGSPARIVCTDANESYPIIAIVTSYEGDKYAEAYTSDGRVMEEDIDRPYDLINIPEKVEK